jgi:hypothetical protein
MTPGEAVIIERLAAHKEQLDRIEVQATKTNGRVTTLELWRARMQGSVKVITWAGPVVSGTVVGLVLHLLG